MFPSLLVRLLPWLLAMAPASPPAGPWPVGEQVLSAGWRMQSVARAAAPGSRISQATYADAGWYPAQVPGTVLGSLVADSVYRHIFFGRNLEKIPDSLFAGPWWFRTRFELPAPVGGAQTFLQFDGINYRADVWLNGQRIAAADTLAGGFRRFVIPVGGLLRAGVNVLAVRVQAPRPGEPTLGFVDWNPRPPDHNMGLWRSVRLKRCGPVALEQPFVRTALDTASLDHAEITVGARLRNGTDHTVTGVCEARIGRDIIVRQPLTLPAQGSAQVIFRPADYPRLAIDHPRLWWVHTLGRPELYDLHLRFLSSNQVSDSTQLRFGIRTVSTYLTPEGHRGFRLNGKKILIRGGGWTDPMLLNADSAYEEAGIDYAVHMRLNALRMEGFWGRDQHLYDLCDEKGLLLMAGWSAQWEWDGVFGAHADQFGGLVTPEQMAVAASSWEDQVTWLRNHPSLFCWLYGSDKLPRPSLEKKYLAILRRCDPTRPALGSAKEHRSAVTGPTAVKMRGPYDYVPPVYWYTDTAYGGAFGFNTETGPGPQVPLRESLEKMIPKDSLWPIGSAWMYHAARGQFHNLSAYNQAMDRRLGSPGDLDDYLRKAQYLNYEGLRAMFEAFESRRFRATGIIQWMYNASWPKLWWQLYDYYLLPTAAFYGTRKAGEPLHIAYDYGCGQIMVINNGASPQGPLRAEAEIRDTAMQLRWQDHQTVDRLVGLATALLKPQVPAQSGTWFLVLRLLDGRDSILSRNLYVLSGTEDRLDEGRSTWYITPQSAYADLRALQGLPAVRLEARTRFRRSGDSTLVRVELRNPSQDLAFMVHLDLRQGQGPSVVPIFWEDNYFSLLPGETRTLSGYCHTADLRGASPALRIGGWNIDGIANP